MAVKSSGSSLAISEINAEFGRGNNLNAYRGTSYFNSDGTTGTFPSTASAISISDFYGKALNRPTISIDVLVVGGGGGGGCGVPDNIGGGGGGGGGGEYGSLSIAAGLQNTISVTIGAGGAAGGATYTYDSYNNPYWSNSLPGSTGGSTSIVVNGVTYTAVGGNGGAAGNGRGTGAGGAGGNGNAGGAYNSAGGSDGSRAGGGGGGVDDANSSGPGGNGPVWYNGNRYSGGGGGGADYSNGGAGGLGGGGLGGAGIAGSAGSANTGGGGGGGASYGGGSWTVGYAGGSGIVILRYAGNARFTAGNVQATGGGYTYHYFTSNTSFTFV